MKQTTLSQSRKRPAAKPLLQPGKRQSGLDGTSLRPIYLESEPADPTASTSNISESKESLSADEHDGPSTSLPLRVRNPTFDLGSLFTHVEAKAIKKDPDLDLLYFKKMIKGRQLYDYLLEELPWYRVVYEIRGNTIRTPRWTCVWGCDETGAPSSVYKIKPRPIPAVLAQLKSFVEKATEAKYNFCLVNLYEDGKDSISWHSDDESQASLYPDISRFLGPLPCIASLSLGSPRDFQMKHKTDKSAMVEKWALDSGDMIVMRGTTQARWLHAVPKRANAQGRINITFRRALNTAGTNKPSTSLASGSNDSNVLRYKLHGSNVQKMKRILYF
ncbi:MAG: hypothetical protein CYPHOPRED_001420, partial [Cyphobasidiales sp. Tagirdzhanova-0007]